MVIVEYWGYFQKIAYSNGDYSVAIFSDAITGKSFKVCGIGIPVAKKIKYHFFGEMQVYKKTGEESLKMVDYEIAELDDESSFVEYLAMPPIKLSRVQGKKIYKLFRDKSVEILDNNPEQVYNAVFRSLKNGDERYQRFIQEWQRQRKLLKITSFLVCYGISRKNASYGDYTIDGYYENGISPLGSDIVYGSSSTPTTRLWSDEPLVNTVTANQHRVRNEKKPITIKINGEKYTPRDTQPLFIDGRVFVPLRFVVEQLGYTVSWDSEEMIAEINDGAIVVEVGSYAMWKYDGMTIPTDVPPFLYQGTLMVGLRQIGNALNYKVGWDEENRVVSLDRAKPNYNLKQHNVFDRSVY